MVNDIDEVLDHAETLVIGNKDSDFQRVVKRLRDDQRLVDFVRIAGHQNLNGNYAGICW